MAKLKPVLPTLRERKRYLVFEVISEHPVTFSSAKKAIWSAVLSFLGTSGTAQAGVWLLPEKYDQKTKRGIIRVSHTWVDRLKASLIFITTIDGYDVIVRSRGISGILKKATIKFM